VCLALFAKVEFELFMFRGGEEHCILDDTNHFAPCGCYGWGGDVEDMSAEDSPALTWDAFWEPGSPYCRVGVVRGRFILAVPDN